MQVISTLNPKNDNKDMKIEEVSTTSEYKAAEAWIDELLSTLNPDYTAAQKIAVIDNAIGKKVSYSPDFDTEVFNNSDCRALYKIISSGYGVCNGISRVEQYILNKAGIESEIVSTQKHAFLKLKDVEFELANGETAVGTTILDPTWNLASHRFGSKPYNFCMSYEEARKEDIDDEGIDHKCHKNDEELSDATFNLDDESLRKLFASVNLADRNGNFPITILKEQSEQIHKKYANQPLKNIEEQFSLLSKTCPEFSTCQNSTMKILEGVLLDNEALQYDRCVINRVYNKSDDKKQPVAYVYFKSADFGEKFYYADKNEGAFIHLPKKDFINQFECYEADLIKNKGIKPWEQSKEKNAEINLATSSGNIIACQEEEER